MDLNPSFEQELHHIRTGRAQQQQQHDPEYGYHVQQPQAQQHYSSLSDSNFGIYQIPAITIGQRLAAAISYSFGWATGFVFFLFAEKRNRFVRFHALQSFLFFGSISVLGFAVGSFIDFATSFNNDFYIGFAIIVPIVIAWIVLILLILMAIAGWFIGIMNALRGRYYKMPFVGDFVERYTNKQEMPK